MTTTEAQKKNPKKSQDNSLETPWNHVSKSKDSGEFVMVGNPDQSHYEQERTRKRELREQGQDAAAKKQKESECVMS